MATIAIACNAILVLFVTWRIASRRLSVFSPLSFFAAGFAYLHVFRAYLLSRRLPVFLQGDPFEFGLAVSFLSLLFLLVGYRYGRARPMPAPSLRSFHYISARTLFLWSCFCLLLYALSSAYLITAHDGLWNWLTAMKTYRSEVWFVPGRAHLYFGMNLFVAAYLLAWIASRIKPSSYILYFRSLFVWTLVVRFFFQSFIAGSRGQLVENGILLAGPFLYRNRSRLVAVTIWLPMMIAGLFGELIGQTRGEYGFGHDKLLPTDIKKSTAFDQEYTSTDTTVYHYTRVYAAWASGKWGYGLSLPDTFWRLIPRVLWPGRPVSLRGVFFPTGGDSIEEVFMIGMPGGGPAPGGIASVFSDFGLAFIAFWFILGFLFRTIDAKAADAKNAAYIAISLSLASGVVHLSVQGLTLFYSCALWSTAPLIFAIRMAKRGQMAMRYRVKPFTLDKTISPRKRVTVAMRRRTSQTLPAS